MQGTGVEPVSTDFQSVAEMTALAHPALIWLRPQVSNPILPYEGLLVNSQLLYQLSYAGIELTKVDIE